MRPICRFLSGLRSAGSVLAVACILWIALSPALSTGAAPAAKANEPGLHSNIPGGSLEANEKGGGHLLSRHVGKTEAELRQRLQSDPKISAASSFTDMPTAETSISAALTANTKRIGAWMKGNDERLAFNYRNDMPVGISLGRAAPKARDAYRVRLVLVRDRKFTEGWRILTAYPEL